MIEWCLRFCAGFHSRKKWCNTKILLEFASPILEKIIKFNFKTWLKLFTECVSVYQFAQYIQVIYTICTVYTVYTSNI